MTTVFRRRQRHCIGSINACGACGTEWTRLVRVDIEGGVIFRNVIIALHLSLDVPSQHHLHVVWKYQIGVHGYLLRVEMHSDLGEIMHI